MCPRTARSKKGDTKSTSNNSTRMSVENGDEVAAASGDAGERLSAPDDTTPNTNGGQNIKGEADYDADAAAEAGAHAARYANWPLKDVKEPTENDVLYGRGGGTNHHPGNKRYRKWVEERKVEYVNSKRLDKPVVALEIVRKWREQSPPGRFLKLDEKTGTWSDVGDKKAREKTSQALREKAPEIRRELEHEANGGGSGGEDGGERTKKTTFDVPEGGGKRKGKKGLNHLMLARDHSLGRDYIQPGESVDVGDFNWAEPVEKLASPRPPPNDRGGSGHYRHSGRNESSGWGSGQFAFVEPPSGMSPRSPHSPYSPYKHSSPPSDYDPRYPPPPPLPGGDVRPLSSGSFPGPPQPPHGAYPYPPSSSFPPPPPGAGGPRDHSLSGYPLRDASISSSARDSFKSSSSRERSRSYEEVPWDARYSAPQYAYPPPQYQQGQAPRSPSGGMLPYPPPPGGPPEYYQSYGYPDRSAFSRAEGRGSRSPSKSDIPPPPVPPQQWDSQPDDFKRVADIIGQDEQPDERGDKRTNSTRADTDGKRSLAKPLGGLRRKISGGGVMPSPPDGAVGTENSSLARPQPVKRDTSHQCENEETKRRVQRCRLARDHSLAGVALNGGDVSHEALRPQDYAFSDPSSHGESGEKIGGDPTIRALSLSMRQSSIADERNKTMDDASPRQAKPPKLSRDQRLSTVDAVRMAFTDEDDLERMIDSSNKYNDLPNVRKENGAPAAGSATASSGPGAVVAGKPDPLTQMDRVSTSDVMAFNLEKDPSILDASSKPLPIAGGDRMNTGSTVDHIIASVEESVQSVSAELNVELSSDLGLPKPLSISDNDRSTTASSILAPADADDIAQEWLVKDSELTAD